MTKKICIEDIQNAVDVCIATAGNADIGEIWIGDAIQISWEADQDWDVYIDISIHSHGQGAHDAVYRWVCQHHNRRHGDCYDVYRGVDSYSVVI